MLENLSNDNSSPIIENEEKKITGAEFSGFEIKNNNQSKKIRKFLGLKSHQLFILLFLLFLVIGMLGAMLLLITGKIAPAFL